MEFSIKVKTPLCSDLLILCIISDLYIPLIPLIPFATCKKGKTENQDSTTAYIYYCTEICRKVFIVIYIEKEVHLLNINCIKTLLTFSKKMVVT